MKLILILVCIFLILQVSIASRELKHYKQSSKLRLAKKALAKALSKVAKRFQMIVEDHNSKQYNFYPWPNKSFTSSYGGGWPSFTYSPYTPRMPMYTGEADIMDWAISKDMGWKSPFRPKRKHHKRY